MYSIFYPFWGRTLAVNTAPVALRVCLVQCQRSAFNWFSHSPKPQKQWPEYKKLLFWLRSLENLQRFSLARWYPYCRVYDQTLRFPFPIYVSLKRLTGQCHPFFARNRSVAMSQPSFSHSPQAFEIYRLHPAQGGG